MTEFFAGRAHPMSLPHPHSDVVHSGITVSMAAAGLVRLIGFVSNPVLFGRFLPEWTMAARNHRGGWMVAVSVFNGSFTARNMWSSTGFLRGNVEG